MIGAVEGSMVPLALMLTVDTTIWLLTVESEAILERHRMQITEKTSSSVLGMFITPL